jgi:predicted esterase
MAPLISGILLFYGVYVIAQPQTEIVRGVVQDTVFTTGDSGDSYALFLPEGYRASEPVPALFVFDPAARGALGVRTFKEAAGSRGWIVIGSNVSRNGPYEKNFEQASRLFSDVLSRFSVDPERIYVAGFSGGARLASTLAVLSDEIRGVIACGAAFSPNAGQMPLPGATFAYAGIVGSRDMNYQELWKADQWLDRVGLAHRTFFYDGVHSWPPLPHLQRAIHWMIMETQKDHTGNEGLARQMYALDSNVADTLYTTGRYLESHWEYTQLVRQYSETYPGEMESIRGRLKQIEQTREYKKQKTWFEKIRVSETRLRNLYSERFRSELQESPPSADQKWWLQQMQSLEKKYGDVAVGGADMLWRIKNQLFAMPIEASESFRRKGEIEDSLYCNELLTLLFAENSRLWIRRAEDLARLQRTDEMIAVLNKAREAGFSDVAAIAKNPWFTPYLTRPDFPFR